jgi:hypothetical protein
MTRDAFLAQCEAAGSPAAIEALLQQCGTSPDWLTGDDAEVAWHCLQLQLLLYNKQQVFRTEVEAREAQAEAQALRDAAQGATDDLDLFQAGYERGYAQGWAHRGVQPKAEDPEA